MRLLRSGIVRNALALYGVQICRKVLPFVSIPYLARILGPTAWGRVAFVQAFSEMLVLLIEFGFTLSATRGDSALARLAGRLRRHYGGSTGSPGCAGPGCTAGRSSSLPAHPGASGRLPIGTCRNSLCISAGFCSLVVLSGHRAHDCSGASRSSR